MNGCPRERHRPAADHPALVGVAASRHGQEPPGTLPQLTAGRRVADRYRLDSVIGEGSMGTVWAATDEVLLRRVAIKQVKYPPVTPTAEVTLQQQRLPATGRCSRDRR